MADADKKPNIFEILADILSAVRTTLEQPGTGGSAADWVKIARVRNYPGGPTDFLAKAVNLVGQAMNFMIWLNLEGQRWLTIGDGYRAYANMATDLAETLVSDDFRNALKALTGGSDPLGSSAAGIKDALASIRKAEDYIPTYDDLLVLGHELYLLFCIEQRALGAISPGDEVDINTTGKLRLVQWAFSSITPAGQALTNPLPVKRLRKTLNDPEDSVDVFRLGTRRLQKDSLPGESLAMVTWSYGLVTFSDEVFHFFYDQREADADRQTKDLQELNQILKKLGYDDGLGAIDDKVFSDNTRTMLRRFQAVNNLLIHGQVDAETLNRLFHLDYTGQNVGLAASYDKAKAQREQQVITSGRLKIVNGNADHPEDERTQAVLDKGYPYYLVGQLASQAKPEDPGWVRDFESDSAPGFVGVWSRRRQAPDSGVAERYDGGLLSIGEASQGNFFFAARQAEPWLATKNNPPGAQALGSATASSVGSRSWLYQKVSLDPVQGRDQGDLFIVASVQVRCLLKKVFGANVPLYVQDKARLLLAAYDDPKAVRLADLVNTQQQDPNKLVFTDPYPGNQLAGLGFEEVRVRRSQYQWDMIRTQELKVPASAKGIVVVLEGAHYGNFDTDVFFDNLQLRWELRKK